MIVIGIDPGLTGAIGVLNTENVKRSHVIDLPATKEKGIITCALYDLLKGYKSSAIGIEQQHSMPRQGVVSTFKTGMNYGNLCAVLDMIYGSYFVLSARKWKGYFNISADKKESLTLARNMFPHLTEELKLKKHHNRAEALLIARFIFETNKGIQ